ncbi:MAG: Crp/Fnr family transcriptional regulator [Gammaproteobacteria bacterium]|uniref:Crp/Fnr family transcriptional regulator n=1 Tax=Hydrogenophaga sp. TaxID=1904254 RepID=UPI0025C48D26|nr:Crp/Fnr family transcriptional regulator [Hydrogenophaga sp.]MBU4182571.1 Crp/Fnr family transcriptional regulator [Gammaproteobacteria bacterium]MBU4279969.1 Crp/Fnr family transcriptional regulator [Gammaproteobacteria bacterium]MCG2657391.1 Crp/Fnr family transcriptional regulator [Hydrogenophaga sp.]
MPTTAAAQPHKAAHHRHVRCKLCAAPQNCLIGRLPVEHRARLAPHIREVAFQKDECLLTEGVVSDVIRIIKRGTAMTTRLGPDRQEHPIALLGRGSLMGKFGLFDQAPQLGVTSVSAGRLCELRIDDLQKTRAMDPAFMHSLHTAMVRAFGHLADWSQVVQLRGLPRQLMATLLLLCQEQGNAVIQLPSRAALANLLSTTRGSITRSLHQLAELGVLRCIDRGHCEVLKLELSCIDAVDENV